MVTAPPPSVAAPRPAIRSARERLLQTLCFEALGLLIVSPLYALCSGASAGESVVLLAVLSVAVMAWSAIYNTAFDLAEARLCGRVASDRTHRLRALHAIAHEASAVLVTWPLIVALTPLGWIDALVADLGLTLAYAVYGYLFHLAFDRLRPVRRSSAQAAGVSGATAAR